jgi:predicted transposase YdaD
MDKEYLTNPHDKFFKESFGRKEIVKSFIVEYLPAQLHQQMDFATLEILKDSYIDKELSAHFSDILYKIKIGGAGSYLYLLFEHKSYADPRVGFQLLRNMVKIWEGIFNMPTIAEKWYQDGIAKGIEKGIEEGKIEDAHKMIDKGMTNADIRDITGLSIKKIQELR